MMFAYLFAWWTVASIAVGALIVLSIINVTGARWGEAYRRDAEAIAGTLPVVALAFIPIAVLGPQVYAWMEPSASLAPAVLRRIAHAHAYLNRTAWTIRAAVFLVVWTVLAEIIIRRRSKTASTLALAVVGVTGTFAVFDWLMSLTPAWSSTMFGLACLFGGILGAVALIAALNPVAAPMDAGALGRLLLGMLAMWAYLSLSQALIIWLGNKPDEVPWYIARGFGGWGEVLAGLVVAGFAIPFAGLLTYHLKRRPRSLALCGAWLVAMHVVDCYWLIVPVRDHEPSPRWFDAAALIVLGGIGFLFGRARRSKQQIVTDYAEAA